MDPAADGHRRGPGRKLLIPAAADATATAAPELRGAEQLRASIAIPTFNRRDILLRTLRSLERQSVAADRYEVIVTVDGSTDGTIEALQAARPPYRLQWIVQENRGSVAAANAAAGLTRNEVLIILGDDQLASPDLVAAHLAVHAQRGTVLVQGEYPLAPGHDRSGASLVYERSRSRSMAALVRANKSVWHLWGGNFSLRRSTWVEIGGFDGSFGEYGAEDTDVALRVAALGIPLVFEPRALTHHLHVVNPRQYARQAFSEGRAVVRLARKHGLPLDGFPGSTIRRPIDRLFAFGWRRRPALMWRLGGVVAAGLAGADRLAIKKMQIAVARALRRFHRVGGITIELTAAGPPAPGHP